jgi:hypothetical protein
MLKVLLSKGLHAASQYVLHPQKSYRKFKAKRDEEKEVKRNAAQASTGISATTPYADESTAEFPRGLDAVKWILRSPCKNIKLYTRARKQARINKRKIAADLYEADRKTLPGILSQIKRDLGRRLIFTTNRRGRSICLQNIAEILRVAISFGGVDELNYVFDRYAY